MARSAAVLVLAQALACRPAPDTTPPPTPAPAPTPAPSMPPVQSDAAVVVEPVAPPTPTPVRRFADGEKAPTGLDPEGIRQFARDQGDPLGGAFDLTQAFVGDAALGSRQGKLFAIIRTDKGAIECELFEREAPITVANFVGLARGVRPFRDAGSKAWITGRFYDGTIFHRVIADFMIQGGDRTGTGRGDIGYVIPDEIANGLGFDAAGVLAMANRGPNSGDSQFFITVAPTPHLAGRHVVFGKCDPKVPVEISKLPVDASNMNRPQKDLLVQRVDFERRSTHRATPTTRQLPNFFSSSSTTYSLPIFVSP